MYATAPQPIWYGSLWGSPMLSVHLPPFACSNKVSHREPSLSKNRDRHIVVLVSLYNLPPTIMMALPQEARVWCNLCSSTIGNDRFKCSYCMIDQGLTCPDWDCCLSCEPSASTQHPGHKLLRILPDNLVPKSPYPDQWHMHPNVHCDRA